MTDEAGPEEEASEHPLKKILKGKMQENQKKSITLAEQYGVALRSDSALTHRLLMVAVQLDPEFDDQSEEPDGSKLLEVIIEKIIGPINDPDHPEYEARLQFEIDWQGVIKNSLELLHNAVVQQKRQAEVQQRLMIPGSKELHLP